MEPGTKVSVGVLLVLLGVLLVAFVWVGPLHNLFEEYQDSQPSTYLIVGGPPLIAGLTCLVIGLRWVAADRRESGARERLSYNAGLHANE